MKSIILSLILLTSSLFFFSTTSAVSFTCNSPQTATCQGLVGYRPVNSTTYSSIQSLFQVSHLSLLTANSLPLSTHPSTTISAGTTVRIPFPCTCSNGTGMSDRTPMYEVTASDKGLDDIARTKFEQFVTYQEIGAVNKLEDVNNITVGEKLWIPLPCSCDEVGGDKVVHLAYIVPAGSKLEAIAQEFGTKTNTLSTLNGITDPKTLQAGQVLDVPLKACSSSIKSTSLDHNLLLPNGSSALTAENCILCSCSSSSSSNKLSCHPVQSLKSSMCPVAKCGNLNIGNTTMSGCQLMECAYAGYTNSTGLSILANPVIQSTSCINNGSEPSAQPSGSFASGLGVHKYWMELFIFIHMAWLGMQICW